MRKYFFASMTVIALVFAQQAAFGQANTNTPSSSAGAKAPYPSTAVPAASEKVTTLNINCYTSQPNCEGLGVFRNTSGNQYSSCSVYFNNGAGGQSNFVLEPGGTHKIHERTGDTEACVWGNSGVPNGTPRNWSYISE
jgi:hypothetical protein